MSVAYILDYPEGVSTLAQYDAVCEVIAPGGVLPAGARRHGAGMRPHGGVRIVDIWDDDAAFERFAETRIVPAASEVGLPEPSIERAALAEVREGGPGEAAFAHVVRIPGLDAAGFADIDRRALPGGGLGAGCLLHANGPSEGGWIAIGYWTSRAARDAFVGGHIVPAMHAAGVTARPVIEDLDLHRVMAPAAAPAAG
jgi:hypothetical protein